MKKLRNISQTNEQDQFIEIDLNEMEFNDLPNREFKTVVHKDAHKIRRGIHDQSEDFNK